MPLSCFIQPSWLSNPSMEVTRTGGGLGATGTGLGAGGGGGGGAGRALGHQHGIGAADRHRLPGREVSRKLFGREPVAPQPDHVLSRRHRISLKASVAGHRADAALIDENFRARGGPFDSQRGRLGHRLHLELQPHFAAFFHHRGLGRRIFKAGLLQRAPPPSRWSESATGRSGCGADTPCCSGTRARCFPRWIRSACPRCGRS